MELLVMLQTILSFEVHLTEERYLESALFRYII